MIREPIVGVVLRPRHEAVIAVGVTERSVRVGAAAITVLVDCVFVVHSIFVIFIVVIVIIVIIVVVVVVVSA